MVGNKLSKTDAIIALIKCLTEDEGINPKCAGCPFEHWESGCIPELESAIIAYLIGEDMEGRETV